MKMLVMSVIILLNSKLWAISDCSELAGVISSNMQDSAELNLKSLEWLNFAQAEFGNIDNWLDNNAGRIVRPGEYEQIRNHQNVIFNYTNKASKQVNQINSQSNEIMFWLGKCLK